MPELNKEFEITQIKANELYQICLEIFKKMGGEDIQGNVITDSPFAGEANAVMPSAWGWGGMKISIKIVETGSFSKFNISGYIAQLGTTPLAKKMDEFLKELSICLDQKYGYSFAYKPVAKEFLPRMKWENKDTVVIIVIIITTALATLASFFLGHTAEAAASALIIVLGYYFGRKLYNSKK